MKNIVFVTDFLPNEITGGAELTLEAIKQAAPSEFVTSYIKSEMVPPHFWQTPNTHFILGNYTRLPKESIDSLCVLAQRGQVDYSVVEFDYKYCVSRNEKVHNYQLFAANQFGFCNCANQPVGTYTKVIFSFAKKVHFMSQEQMNLIIKRIPEIAANKENLRVQWSTWNIDDLNFIEELTFIRNNNKKNNNKFAIQKSSNWLKGTQAAIEYAQKNNLEYDLIDSMEYRKFLETLCDYKGFIFLPNAYDTCPRVVVEAKLLGLEYVINDNVQIKNELLEAIPGELLDKLRLNARNFWKNYEL